MKKYLKIIIRILEIFCTFYTIFSIFFLKPYYPNKEITLYTHNIVNLFNKQFNTDKIDISYNDEKVNNLYMSQYTIRNTGNLEIIPEDYIERIKITGDFGRIIDINIVECSSKYIKETLETNVQTEESNLILPNILLNVDDYYTINIISDKPPIKIGLSYALSGIKEINCIKDYNSFNENIKWHWRYRILNIIMILIISLVIIIIISFIYSYNKKEIKFLSKKFKCSLFDAKLLSKVYYKRIDEINNLDLNDEEKKML